MPANKTNEELQKQARDLLRAQQEAYLAAVKEWRKAVAAQGQLPPLPKLPMLDTLPTAAETAQANYAFASKLLADQSRFMEELSKAMAGPEGSS
jgi:hypothetical protein